MMSSLSSALDPLKYFPLPQNLHSHLFLVQPLERLSLSHLMECKIIIAIIVDYNIVEVYNHGQHQTQISVTELIIACSTFSKVPIHFYYKLIKPEDECCFFHEVIFLTKHIIKNIVIN